MAEVKLKIKNFKLKITDFIIKNYRELLILIVILSIGAFLRLYRIGEYMTFLGDEGRDAILVRRFLVNFDLMLIGPGTSVGNMYLGPLYYYFIAPSLWLAKFSPVGPSIMIALLGIATILFVYLIGKEWFSKKAGYIASFLYAISPTVIIFSKSSWNPNIMPFFSLLSIYSIWKVWKKENYFWVIITAISFAFVLQSHYLGILLGPVLVFYWILTFLKASAKSERIDDKAPVTKFIRNSLIALVIFLFLMSPLLIFDIRHGWLNLNSVSQLFSTDTDAFSFGIWSTIPRLPEILNLISTRLLAGKINWLGEIIVAVVSIPSILLLLGRKKLHKNEASGFSTLALWMLSGIIGLGFFRYSLNDHYFGFLFPAPFLFLGGFLDGISENLSKVGKITLALAFVFVAYVNISNSPLKFSPNRQMQRAQSVAEKIIEESSGVPFNLAVLAQTNYEDGYGYFLEKEGYNPLHADVWNKESISDQLFVVCEMESDKCDPTHSPKAEVANFGWTDIESSWQVEGVTIYKLIHSKVTQ